MSTCVICDQANNRQRHFGVQACRACSAFFRRSLAEGKEYKCKFNGDCNVKKNYRNFCRACRLQKCYEAGMRREDVKEIRDSPSSSQDDFMEYTVQTFIDTPKPLPVQPIISPQLFSDSNLDTSTRFSTLHKISNGVKSFQDAQKAMIIAHNPEILLNPSRTRYITKSEFDYYERLSIPLIYNMLLEYFEPFILLSQEQRVECLKRFHPFAILVKMYQSAVIYPDPENNTFVCHYGYLCDSSNDAIRTFVSEHRIRPEDHYQLTLKIFNRGYYLSRHIKLHKMNDIDMAALCYIMFYVTCEDFTDMFDVLQNHADQVFKEIHEYYMSSCGVEEGGVKFAHLIQILNEIMHFYHKLHEDISLAKIFLDDFFDCWLDLEKSNQVP